MKRHPLIIISSLAALAILVSVPLGFRFQEQPFLSNLLAGFVDIALGTIVGVFLVDALVRQDRQDKWSKSRNYVLGAVASHLIDFAVYVLVNMPIKDHSPIRALFDGREKPNTATVNAIKKVAALLRSVEQYPSPNKTISDYVVELYESRKWDLDQIQLVLTPLALQSEVEQELIDSLMDFDRARRHLHEAIIGHIVHTANAADTPLIELIDSTADLYIVISKYWKPVTRKAG